MDKLGTRQARRVSLQLLETFAGRLDWLSVKTNGSLTVNALRVRASIAMAMLANEQVTSSDIARRTKLNPTTVHRIITTMIEEGIVREHAHPEDGRKRLLGYTDDHWESLEQEINEWVALSLRGITEDLKILTEHGLLPEKTPETVAEFVLQVRRDGTLSLASPIVPNIE